MTSVAIKQCVLPALVLTIAAALIAPVGAQDTRPLIESPDTHYYDFWLGRWAVVKDGRVDPSGITFTVTRSVHPGALEEVWGGGVNAHAFRAWDKTTNK